MKQSRKLAVLRDCRVLFEAGSFSGLSDGELLARFVEREGDTAEMAFVALVERHAGAVMRICQAIVRNEHDAEDAFQATFLVLAAKAGRLRVRESLGPWLGAVARRVARGARAAALVRVARELRAATVAVARDSGSESGDVVSILREEIDRLPERYRLPLLLCDLESHTQQEAARRLGWPLGTVKSRQARARARLRARLLRRGLPGVLLAGEGFGSAQAAISDRLIQLTARAAASCLPRGPAAGVISASVATLVTNSLRGMIVGRPTSLLVGALIISAGVAASVLAQGQAAGKKAAADPSLPGATRRAVAAAAPAPVLEYEIRIWKDGAPVMPTVKLRAHPGELSEVKIPEGTFELRFRPRRDGGKKDTTTGRRGSDRKDDPRLLGGGDLTREGEYNMLAQQAINTQLEIMRVESELKVIEIEEENARQRPDERAELLEPRIRDEFQRDPEVIALSDELAEATEQKERARRVARNADDPAVKMADARYQKLNGKYNDLWVRKYREISDRLFFSTVSEPAATLRRKLKSLNELNAKLTKVMAEFKIEDGKE